MSRIRFSTWHQEKFVPSAGFAPSGFGSLRTVSQRMFQYYLSTFPTFALAEAHGKTYPFPLDFVESRSMALINVLHSLVSRHAGSRSLKRLGPRALKGGRFLCHVMMTKSLRYLGV
jgi:hypothetical protein